MSPSPGITSSTCGHVPFRSLGWAKKILPWKRLTASSTLGAVHAHAGAHAHAVVGAGRLLFDQARDVVAVTNHERPLPLRHAEAAVVLVAYALLGRPSPLLRRLALASDRGWRV